MNKPKREDARWLAVYGAAFVDYATKGSERVEPALTRAESLADRELEVRLKSASPRVKSIRDTILDLVSVSPYPFEGLIGSFLTAQPHEVKVIVLELIHEGLLSVDPDGTVTLAEDQSWRDWA